ncbi:MULTISPECIES: hypothetical protein [Rhizobium/Agrobacterium group]|uniref:hypothetical protein n=1 Tax=Rhizobium/Agrobacterium group TaxID=227290 RepID=UPI0015743362|nr:MULTISPECIES: hypothetical protein [Rhizobium/Agrobacterium group]NTD86782.1 hypothetical protein [Agrobacterium tumefaciens]NTD91509.1 hypothetical protein [Agrobacterium tumefaciens]NTE11881.1 hypothetical protein [Agrobacterium tumefaciens]NTE29782.1 hypothetical protein [Agrobacterium tumefaciens]NTE38335.1 hypothetical protein [Agrobacterium tumefaciens]
MHDKAMAPARAPSILVDAVVFGPFWSPFRNKPDGLAWIRAGHHKIEPCAAVKHEMELRQLPSLLRRSTLEGVANVMVFLAANVASLVSGSDSGSFRYLV